MLDVDIGTVTPVVLLVVKVAHPLLGDVGHVATIVSEHIIPLSRMVVGVASEQIVLGHGGLEDGFGRTVLAPHVLQFLGILHQRIRGVERRRGGRSLGVHVHVEIHLRLESRHSVGRDIGRIGVTACRNQTLGYGDILRNALVGIGQRTARRTLRHVVSRDHGHAEIGRGRRRLVILAVAQCGRTQRHGAKQVHFTDVNIEHRLLLGSQTVVHGLYLVEQEIDIGQNGIVAVPVGRHVVIRRVDVPTVHHAAAITRRREFVEQIRLIIGVIDVFTHEYAAEDAIHASANRRRVSQRGHIVVRQHGLGRDIEIARHAAEGQSSDANEFYDIFHIISFVFG